MPSPKLQDQDAMLPAVSDAGVDDAGVPAGARGDVLERAVQRQVPTLMYDEIAR